MAGALFAVAGVVFSISWFVFFDAFVVASKSGYQDDEDSIYYTARPFNLVMFIPGLLALLAMAILLCVKPEHIVDQDSDESIELIGGGGNFGGEEESAILRSKILFCISFFVFFSALGMGVWKLIDPYTKGIVQVDVQNTTVAAATTMLKKMQSGGGDGHHQSEISSSSLVQHVAYNFYNHAKESIAKSANLVHRNTDGGGNGVEVDGDTSSSYKRAEKINVWPGIAVVIHVALLISSGVLCLIGRRKTQDDALLFY